MKQLYRGSRTVLLAVLVLACGGENAADAAGTLAASLPPIADVGLETPESVLHDETADVYLVSNINGRPLDHDDNGFIARIRPDGRVEQLKWIDGAREDVTLHAPKGMAIMGDTLFVADIETVRAFHRVTGQPLRQMTIQGALFLNDIAAIDGELFVSDTGIDSTLAITARDAVYRMTPAGAVPVARGDALARPNGIAAGPDGTVLFVPTAGSVVMQVSRTGGAVRMVASLPVAELDGLLRLPDGSLLVSSWGGSAVYRVRPGSMPEPVAIELQSPADIGYDARRKRLLIPLFALNRIEIRQFD